MIRSALVYILMVGLPVGGISAVLKAGRNLVPPASFGGRWRVEAWPDPVCLLTGTDTLNLVIEQSGPALTIKSRRGLRFEGRVEGEGFSARGGRHREIRAARVPATHGAEFEGVVSGSPCDAATVTRIKATRVSLPSELTGH